jgi:hypothetical protein
MHREPAQAQQLLQSGIEHAAFIKLVLDMRKTCYTSKNVDEIVGNHLTSLRTRLTAALNLYAADGMATKGCAE